MIAIRLIAIAAASLLAVQVVRNAGVDALGETRPESAARLWPGHPTVELERAMVGIAEASRARSPIPQSVFLEVADAARKAPLDARPFLIRGVQAQIAGDQELAVRSFLAAQQRDPRSLPAAYFLADHYLRSGKSNEGLDQVATLARLAPDGVQSMAPFVAAYARDRAHWPRLRTIFDAQPQLQNAVVDIMAGDAANADAILAVASPTAFQPSASWVPKLLAALVSAGQYERARSLWARVSKTPVQSRDLVFDPAFSDSLSPPPFNWALTSSTVGLAERQPGGRLHVIFYGEQEGPLARQLLLLAPGRYRLGMKVSAAGDQADALNWVVRCEGASGEIARVPLAVAGRGAIFTVPAGCRAQWLELVGSSSDIPQQADITVSDFSLRKEGGNA